MSTRIAFPGGPGYLTFNGAAILMEQPWNISNEPTQFKVETNLDGIVDWREEDTVAKVAVKPVGLWGAYGAALYPYQPSMRGQLIFPPTDVPLIVQTTTGGAAGTGRSLTYAAAALSKMPPLQWAGNKVLFGSAEFTLLRAMSVAPTVAGAFVTVADSPYTEPALNPQLILTSPASITYGGIANLQTEEDGVIFTPTVQLTPRKTSQYGIVNYEIGDVTATVEFTPEGLTESDLYSNLHRLDGTGTGRGTSIAGIGGALTITSLATGGPILTCQLAAPTKSSLRFDPKTGRLGKLTLQVLRASVSGVLQPLFALSTH